MNRSTLSGYLAFFAIAGMLSATPAAAAQSTVDFLLDLDDDATTGCTVTTSDGPFDGVEQILSTTVETVGSSTANVTAVDRQECTDPGTDTFGAPIAVDPGDWPVGVGLGEDGFHVVETYFPLAATALDPQVVRIGVVHGRPGAEDTLLVAVPGTDTPILLELLSILEIPTLGQWGLILLALLLAAGSLHLLGRRGTAALVAVLLLSTAGLAWAQCVLDGMPGDWTVSDLLGADPAASDDGIAVRAVFGRGDGGRICLRADVSLTFDEPPTITDIADQTIPEDGTTGALAFTVGDAEDAATALTVTATSSNQVLVPDGNLALAGSGANRTITVTPAANQNGMTMVTVTVEDTAGGTASTTFMVTVTSQNDPPTISAIADQTILEDGITGALAFTVGDTETAASNLTVTASSSDQTIIPDGNLALAGTDENRTITVTPAADQNGGPVTITVLVQDTDGGSTPEQFGVTVTPVNDAPSFALAGDVSSDEDAGPQMVANQATAISAGPANEAGQTVTFQVTNDDNALFSSQPAIDSTGTLTYESAADANGSATVMVTAMDDGGTADGGVDTSATQSFTITINPVDDPGTAGTDVYRTVGNTLLEVDDTRDDPLPSIFAAGTVLANDSDPDTALSVTGTSGVTAGAVVNMAADGTFTYVPPPGLRGDGNPATADDSFQYQLAGGELGTVEIDIDGLVWYVDNTANGGTANTGTGTSVDRFSTLSDGDVTPNDAEDASIAGDLIYVFQGGGTNTNYDAGFTMKDGQVLLGEGVDLVVDVNGTPTTLFTGNTANKPLVQAASGTAVAFGNAAGEVAGLDVRGEHGVSVAPGGGSSVVVRDNALTGLNGSAALFVDHNDAGAQDLAVLRNTIGGTVGADLTNTQGTLNLVFDGNTGLESTDGVATAAGSFAAAGGDLFVTSFSANQVAGTTATSGLRFDGVIFDADPSDADFTGDEVVAGNTAVGSAGDPVAGSALVLTNVSGDLAFGTLDLFTDGVDAVALDATGGGVFNAAAGTGFEITNTGGTVSSANGPAVDLDPLTAGLTFDSVSSGVTTGGAHAIRLHDLAGSFTVTGGTLANTSGSAVAVTGTNPGDSSIVVSLSGMTINHGTGTTPVILGQNSSGMFSLTGSTISKGGGRLVDFDDMDGGSDFTGTTISSTDHHGKRLIDSSGTHTFADVVIDSATPAPVEGVFLQNNTGTVNFGKVDVHSNAAPAFFASNGGTVNVADATSQLTARGHRALDASGTTFNSVTFAGATVPAANPSATGGVMLSSNTGTLTIGKVDVTTTGGTGFSATNAGTVNVTDATSRIDSTNGPGLVINPTAVNLEFALVRSMGSGTTGIDITGASGTGVTIASADVDDTAGAGVQLTNNTAPVAINGGTIGETVNTANTTGGNALDVDGGSAAVTVAAAITNSASRSVEVTGRTGGTVTVGGAIADTGTGVLVSSNSTGSTVFSSPSKVINTGGNDAVTLTNNTGHLIDFAGGGLDVDTTSGAGFTATGGGTVQVRGAGNTVDTTTGTAVNVSGATIGPMGITLQSVTSTAAGSNTAITLGNTGAGAFEVTGTGSAGTGGTIANKTVDAVTLDNTDGSVTLRHMILEDIGNMGVIDSEHDAIHGQDVDGGLVLDGVTIRRISDMAIHGAGFPAGDADTVWNGLTITNSTFEDANRYHVAGEGDTSDEGTVRIRGLRGTALIDGNTFQDGAEHLDLFATAGTLDLTVTGNSFFDTYKEFASGPIASVGKMCADLTVQGAANATVDVSDGNAFRNCRIGSVRVANDAGATGAIASTVAGNSFLVTDHSSGSGGDFDFPMGGVAYKTRGAAGAVFDGRITGNSFTDVTNADGGVGNVTLDMDGGVIQVLVDGNTFHAPGNAAWFVRADGTSSFALEFDTNTYERDAFPCTTDPSCGGGYFGPGLFNRVQVQNGAVIDVTLNNEALAQHDVGFDPGNTVEVQVLNVGGGGTACAAFSGNASPHGYALEESAGTLNLARGVSAIGLPATCSGGAPANCVTVLGDNSNTGGGGNPAADPPTVSVFGTIDIVSSACALPSGAIF